MSLYLLDVPGTPDHAYRSGEAFLSQVGAESVVEADDLDTRSCARLLGLAEEFDRFRGLPGAGTPYRIEGYWEQPATPEDHPYGWTYFVAYYHLDRDTLWSDEPMCLRAVLDMNGDFIDVRYGFKNVDGNMAWANLAAGVRA